MEKTGYIIFFNPKRSASLIGHAPPRIALRDAVNGQFTVPRATSIWYLGVFFQYNLRWDLHVRTMSNRARSTIRALHILGNSIKGLDFANWQKVFHAIVLPVLTYGAAIWDLALMRSHAMEPSGSLNATTRDDFSCVGW